ncbi:MAG: LL-diaminopimelate aminotransferase [Methanocellales archaeon]
MVKVEYADRINALPQYLFAAIDELKQQKIKEGVDVIDLGVGDPDQPTPNHIVEAACQAIKDPKTHRYPSYIGLLSFREAVAEWYKKTFNVNLDPEKEVISLIGSKEGIAHLPLAFINPGDIALVPDPAYPVYKIGVILANGKPYTLPLLEQNDFLPDLSLIPRDIARKAKLMYINYPNNPTSAIASKAFFKEIVDFAREYEIIVVHDNAYSEITYDGYKAPSFLEVEGAMEVGIEYHSLSKTYNMTGWRIGFAVGNSEVLTGLGKVKTNVDSGVFEAIQIAGIAALKGDQKCVENIRKIYQDRRDLLLEGLKKIGLKARKPLATFYIWAKIPEEYSSMEYSKLLLDKAGIVATPGIGFGKFGDKYIRFALTKDLDKIKEAVERMEKI